MGRSLACLLIWISICTLISGNTAAQTAGKKTDSPLLIAQFTQPTVPSRSLPSTKLPSDAVRSLKEIPPNITVTWPAAGRLPEISASAKIILHLNGNISAISVALFNIKSIRYIGDAYPRAIATGVPVQNGTGSYLWNIPADFTTGGKGGGMSVIIVIEAGNGSVQGVGGKVEAGGPDSKECASDK
jgi:hypothetical protein